MSNGQAYLIDSSNRRLYRLNLTTRACYAGRNHRAAQRGDAHYRRYRHRASDNRLVVGEYLKVGRNAAGTELSILRLRGCRLHGGDRVEVAKNAA